jgi:hypothetical protein
MMASVWRSLALIGVLQQDIADWRRDEGVQFSVIHVSPQLLFIGVAAGVL